MGAGGKNLQGRAIKMPLKPIKSVLILTAVKIPELTANGSSQWYVAEYEGKLVIPVPAQVRQGAISASRRNCGSCVAAARSGTVAGRLGSINLNRLWLLLRECAR
jgi:hypothetical protein